MLLLRRLLSELLHPVRTFELLLKNIEQSTRAAVQQSIRPKTDNGSLFRTVFGLIIHIHTAYAEKPNTPGPRAKGT